jgi:hypothetical protein
VSISRVRKQGQQLDNAITQQAGAGVLMIGTDYGHQDMSVELDALRTLGERGDLRPGVAQQILDDNPRALYGL